MPAKFQLILHEGHPRCLQNPTNFWAVACLPLPAVEGELLTLGLGSGSEGACVVDGRDNAWRSRAPGPHAHGNAARQVVDGLRTEVWGQQKQSNDPRNNQHNPNTPTTGRS